MKNATFSFVTLILLVASSKATLPRPSQSYSTPPSKPLIWSLMNGQLRTRESFSRLRPEHTICHNSMLRMRRDTRDSQIKDRIRRLVSGIDGRPCPDWAGGRVGEDPGELLPFPKSRGLGVAGRLPPTPAPSGISVPESQRGPSTLVV